MAQPSPPPPFAQPYPPPQRGGGIPGWVWGIVGCVLAASILAAILFPVFAQTRQVSCLANLRQISVGMKMYALDHNAQFPRGTRWMDAMGTYVKLEGPEGAYHCPSVSPGGYGYAFDSRLSGKKVAQIADPQQKMLVYDSTNLNRNATDAGTSLPREKPRHGRSGNNVLYADGSVRFTRVTSAD